MYFERDEKLGFLEELIFDHKYDDDTEMIIRNGVNTEFVHIACLLVILAIVAISKMF